METTSEIIKFFVGKDTCLVEFLLYAEYKLGVYDEVKNKILYATERYGHSVDGTMTKVVSKYHHLSNLTTIIPNNIKTELMMQMEQHLKTYITEERDNNENNN